jgi:hypothetical protein
MSYDKNDPELNKKLVTKIIKSPENLIYMNKKYDNKNLSNRLNDIYNSLVEQKLRKNNKSRYDQRASTSLRAASSASSRAARTSSPDFHAEYSRLYGNPPLLWTHGDSSSSPVARRASSSATRASSSATRASSPAARRASSSAAKTGYGLGLRPNNNGVLDIVPRERNGGTTQKKRPSTTKSKSRK